MHTSLTLKFIALFTLKLFISDTSESECRTTTAPKQDEQLITTANTSQRNSCSVMAYLSPTWADDFEVTWNKLPQRFIVPIRKRYAAQPKGSQRNDTNNVC